MLNFLTAVALFATAGSCTYMFSFFAVNPGSINFSESPFIYVGEAIVFLAVAIFGLTRAIKLFYNRKHESGSKPDTDVRKGKGQSE